MATKLYLKTAFASGGTMPSSYLGVGGYSWLTSGASTARQMTESSTGGSQSSMSGTSGANTNSQRAWLGTWVSPPLAAQTISGRIDWNVADSESNGAMNFWANNIVVAVWRPSTGALVGQVIYGYTTPTSAGSEGSTSATVSKGYFSAVDNAVACQAGDVLVVQMVGGHTQSMSSAYTGSIFYNGTTENNTENASVTDHASYVLFDNTLTWQPASIELNASVSAVSTATATELTSTGWNASASCQASATASGLTIKFNMEATPASSATYAAGTNTPNLASSVLWSANGKLFLFYDPLTTSAVYKLDISSDSGDTWTQYDIATYRAASVPTGEQYTVLFDGTNYYAVTGSGVSRSPNTLSWTGIGGPTADNTITYRRAACGNGRVVMMDVAAIAANGKIHVSTNSGDSWTTYTGQTVYGLWFANGYFFKLYNPGAGIALAQSSDAVSWTDVSAPGSLADLKDVVYFKGRYILVFAGSFASSPDLAQWTTQSAPTTNFYHTSVHADSVMTALAVGVSGGSNDYDLAISTDGISWDFTLKGTVTTGSHIAPTSSGHATRPTSGAKTQRLTLRHGSRCSVSASAAASTAIRLAASLGNVTSSTADLTAGPDPNFSSQTIAVLCTASASLTTVIRPNASVAAVSAQSSALTTAIRLVASPTAQTNQVLASLNTGIPLVASITAQAAQTSALSTQTLFAASVSATTAATSSLVGASAALEAAVTVTTGSSGILHTSIEAAGSAQAATSVSATLTTGVRFATGVLAETLASATLTTGVRLNATATASCTAATALTTGVRFVASETAQTNTIVASLNTGIPLTVQMSAQAYATAGVTTAIRLEAALLSQASVFGGLAANTAQLEASATVSVSATTDLLTQIVAVSQVQTQTVATAQLSTDIRLEASTSAGTNNVLALLSTGETVSADAAALASATGILSTGIRFVAQAASATGVAGDLNTLISLQATSGSNVDAAAGLTVGVLLTSDTTALCSVQGELEVASRFVSLAEIAAVAYADLATEILFAADVGARSVLQGALSTALANLGQSGFRVVVPAALRSVSVSANDDVLTVPYETRSVVVPNSENRFAVPPEQPVMAITPD